MRPRCVRIPIKATAREPTKQAVYISATSAIHARSLLRNAASLYIGSNSDLGPRLSLVRSSLNNGHAGAAASCPFGAISGREQCDPGQSILVAPIAGRYDKVGDRDRVAIAGARWDL